MPNEPCQSTNYGKLAKSHGEERVEEKVELRTIMNLLRIGDNGDPKNSKR